MGAESSSHCDLPHISIIRSLWKGKGKANLWLCDPSLWHGHGVDGEYGRRRSIHLLVLSSFQRFLFAMLISTSITTIHYLTEELGGSKICKSRSCQQTVATRDKARSRSAHIYRLLTKCIHDGLIASKSKYIQ